MRSDERHDPAEREQGAIALLLALVMSVLLVFGAFAVDLSNSFQQRALTENAADAGTFAAVSGYRSAWAALSQLAVSDPTRRDAARSSAFTSAHRYLLVNSHMTAAQYATCIDPVIQADQALPAGQRLYTAVSPHAPGCVAVNDRDPERPEFRVWVPRLVKGTFSQTFTASPLRANGSAKLAITMGPAPQSSCGIYALAASNRTGQGAATFDLNGIGTWSVSGCAHSNGNTLIQNPSQITTPAVRAVGTVSCTATVGFVCPPPHVNGSAQPNSAWVNDPLRHLPNPPAPGIAASFDTFLQNCACQTLTPGTYSGPYNTIGNGATIYLMPGNYTFINDGQPFNIGGSLLMHPSATATDGVTLFFMGGGEKLMVRNGGIVNLRAQRTGPYANVLFYYDRSAIGQMGLRVNPGSSLQGTVYLPNGELRFDVQMSGWNTTSRFIAATISNQQTAFNINIDESTNAQLIF